MYYLYSTAHNETLSIILGCSSSFNLYIFMLIEVIYLNGLSQYISTCCRWKQRTLTELVLAQMDFTSKFTEWVNMLVNNIQGRCSAFLVLSQDSRSWLWLWLKLWPSLQLLQLWSGLFRGGNRLSDWSSQGQNKLELETQLKQKMMN